MRWKASPGRDSGEIARDAASWARIRSANASASICGSERSSIRTDAHCRDVLALVGQRACDLVFDVVSGDILDVIRQIGLPQQ